MKFSHYNGKRIALVMDVQGREVVLRGTTSLRTDAHQGKMLQVKILDGPDSSVGCPVFLISEQRWREQICSGFAFGCDYLLDLSSPVAAAS